MRILTTISNYLDEASGVEIFTVTAIIVLLLFIYPIIQAVISFRVKKIFPSFHRLLLGLSGRKIAIFATHDIFTSLESMLIDSKLFTKKEILQIQADSIDKAENSSLFLVYWPDFNDNLDAILAIKKDATALVVYAPQDKGRIDSPDLNKINSKRNALIANMRGRLLNDIVSSLISTRN